METDFGEMQMVHILEEIYKDIDEEVFSARITLIDGLLENYIENQKKIINSGTNESVNIIADLENERVRRIIIASLIRSKIRREDSNNGFNRLLYFIFNNDTHNVDDIIDIYDVNENIDSDGKTSYTLIVKEQPL